MDTPEVTYFCDHGHIAGKAPRGYITKDVFRCPFCKSTNIKAVTEWGREHPIGREKRLVTVPIYDVSVLFPGELRDRTIPIVHMDRDFHTGRGNAYLMAASPELLVELEEADQTICRLCYIVNPHHATADHGVGCRSCEERETRLAIMAKARGVK